MTEARGDITGQANLRLSGPGGSLAAYINFGAVPGASPPCARTDGVSGYIVELTPGAQAMAAGGEECESDGGGAWPRAASRDGRSSGRSSPRGAGGSLALESRSSAAFDSASLHAASGDEGLAAVHGSPGKGRFLDKYDLLPPCRTSHGCGILSEALICWWS